MLFINLWQPPRIRALLPGLSLFFLSLAPACASVNADRPPEGMVLVPGGTFTMGGDAGLMDGGSASHRTAYPRHEVTVDTFWMDETEVTNRQFAAFVDEAAYATVAEQPLPEALVRQLREAATSRLERLKASLPHDNAARNQQTQSEIQRLTDALESLGGKAGAIVFSPPQGQLTDPWDSTQWWRIEPAANWRQPDGPGSSWSNRLDHPVVNLTRRDAAAYAEWAGKRLPTEAEWERAARGGLEEKPFVWGDVFQPDGQGSFMANTWQGTWPIQNSGEDGFVTTAPVRSFPPNRFGLYDMAGNVWEITADVYHPHTYRMRSPNPVNPSGPDPRLLKTLGRPVSHVIRGGSFLCSDSWCSGYQPGSRQSLQADSPAHHTGFRCVRDIPGSSRTPH